LDDRWFLLHLRRGHFVRRQDWHHLLDAVALFQRLLGAVPLLAQRGDDGAVRPLDHLAAQAQLLHQFHDVIDLLSGGARLHDDDHPRFPFLAQTSERSTVALLLTITAAGGCENGKGPETRSFRGLFSEVEAASDGSPSAVSEQPHLITGTHYWTTSFR